MRLSNIYVCMYVCMYVCIYIYIQKLLYGNKRQANKLKVKYNVFYRMIYVSDKFQFQTISDGKYTTLLT